MKRVVALLILVVCCVAVQGASPEPRRVVVLSYNIHHGEGMDRKIDLERIANVIRSVKPDLVALREVDRKTRRSQGVDQAGELARLTGMKMVFGRTIDHQGGLYGNAVLSRLPIVESSNHAVPFTKGREPRAVLEVEIAPPASGDGLSFVLLATHFDYTRDPADRLAAVRAIAKIVEESADRPTLLAGDLNATPESQTLKALGALWQVAGAGRTLHTSPVARPRRQIDFILYRPANRWKVDDVRVLDERVASDHRPIVAALELLPPPGASADP